ncbi:MAG: hypothetical protein H7Y42_18295 [Chitinophagaceae bacterium]|nr:hypothetical protein [Chitinophagaceae bacterium]
MVQSSAKHSPYLYKEMVNSLDNRESKKYFIQQYLQEDYQHGGIGGTDAERILVGKGFQPIFFPHQNDFSILAKVKRFLFLRKTLFSIEKNAVVLFLFPVYARINRLLLSMLAKRKDVTVVCFLADINGLKDGNKDNLQEEIAFFKKFNYFIVHSGNMEEWVKAEVAPSARITAIELFDFLAEPDTHIRDKSFDIVFAGNLEKSGFLDKLHTLKPGQPSLHFHLYGAGHSEDMVNQDNVTWHGVFPPYELPAKLEGSFGLVWDGDGIDKPMGSLGQYMQFISHHKLSLYILSSIPLIVPASAASAGFVERNKIGFTINGLHEIESKIHSLTSEKYLQMQFNMRPIARKISEGGFLGAALEKVLLNG